MFRLLSAITLTAVWVVTLFAFMAPIDGVIENGLDSGRRIALAQYAADVAP